MLLMEPYIKRVIKKTANKLEKSKTSTDQKFLPTEALVFR